MDLSGKLIKGTGSYSISEIAPPVESGQLLLNSRFENWTAGNPDDYALAGQDANNYTEEVSTGMHFVADGSGHFIYQTSLGAAGRSYKIVVDVPVVTSGSIRIYLTSGTQIYVDTPGVYTYYSTQSSTTFYIQGDAGGTDVIVRSIEIEEVPEGYPLMDKGMKYLECQVGGTGSVAIPSDQAYGEWEFDLYKSGTIMDITLCASIIDVGTPYTYNLYWIRIAATGAFSLVRGASTILGSNVSYVLDDLWYRVKITRTLDGEFYVYIIGGDFGNDDWILLDVSGGSGTNPATDNTYTESQYLVLDLDIGDRIANLIMRKGVSQ